MTIGASRVLHFGLGIIGNGWFNHVKDEAAEEYLLFLYELCAYETLEDNNTDLSEIYLALFLYNSPPH